MICSIGAPHALTDSFHQNILHNTTLLWHVVYITLKATEIKNAFR